MEAEGDPVVEPLVEVRLRSVGVFCLQETIFIAQAYSCLDLAARVEPLRVGCCYLGVVLEEGVLVHLLRPRIGQPYVRLTRAEDVFRTRIPLEPLP